MTSSSNPPPEVTSGQEERQKVRDLIKDISFCQLVTQDDAGRMYARPMMAQEQDANDDLWFFTAADSPKVEEIRRNPQVLLTYSDPQKNSYVSVSGTAEVFRDQSRINQLWGEGARAWFPAGPTDPNLCLVRVMPESAEYWDAPSSAFVIAYGYAKARLTGERPEGGENKIVQM